MEATWAPVDRWMAQKDVVHTHTHNGIVLGREKESNNDIQQRGMNLEIIVLSELSQRKTSTIW